jgi:SAM-dependent methyltransferase
MKPNLVLDAGCGTGNLSCELARAFPQATVVAVDFSEPSIAVAKKNYNRSNIEYHVGNLEKGLPLAPEQKADLVYCQGVIHHLANPLDALKNIRSHIQDDGRGFVWLYNPAGRRRISDIMALSKILSEGAGQTDVDVQSCLDAETILNKTNGYKRLEYLLYRIQSYGWRDIFSSFIADCKRKFSKKAQEHFILNKMDDYMNPRAKFYTIKEAIALFGAAGFEVEQILELDQITSFSAVLEKSVKEKQDIWFSKEIVYQPKGVTYVIKPMVM